MQEESAFLGYAFGGRYVAERVIGRGGMGIVYAGRDAKTKVAVAIKILRLDRSSCVEMDRRFRREVRTVEMLDHPNTIRFVAGGAEPDGTFYLVTELLVGRSLTDILELHPTGIGEARSLEMIDQIAASLEEAHAHRIVHRDIKPSNVFLDVRNRVRVLDFGLAQMLSEDPGTTFMRTPAGMIMYTPVYASPEQARGEEIDHRTDIYSLGVVAFHCLSGRPPFVGGMQQLFEAHLSRAIPRINEVAQGVHVSPAVESLVRKMMAKRCEDRFANIRAVRTQIGILRNDAGPTKLIRDRPLVRASGQGRHRPP